MPPTMNATRAARLASITAARETAPQIKDIIATDTKPISAEAQIALNQSLNAIQMMVQNNVISTQRASFLRQMFDPRRDINEECGYANQIQASAYRIMYDREIGRRVVNVYPEETWMQFPRIWEDEDADTDTDFEASLDALENQSHLLYYLQRADELSGVGCYGIILWGLSDGKKLDEPVEGCETWAEATGLPPVETRNKYRLLYIRVLDESLIAIAEYEKNYANPRFGLPTYYNITLADPNRLGSNGTATPPDFTQTKVHWSRITHVADNRKTSEVAGTPRQEPVWNRLCDLRKVLGGSGEMFWKGGFPGIALETQPGMENATIDQPAAQSMMYDYMNGLQRYIALQGFNAKSLAPQIAEPTESFEVQIKAICITLGVPYRVFMGIEEGVVSGDQATRAWAGRLANRQSRYVTPMLINPAIQRLIDYGIVAPTAEPYGWTVEWPNLLELSATEKADVSLKKTQALAEYVKAGADVLVPPLQYLTTILDFTDEEAQQVVDAAEEHLADVQAHEHAEEETPEVVAGRQPKAPTPPEPAPGDVILKPGDKLVPGGKAAKGNPKPKPKSKKK